VSRTDQAAAGRRLAPLRAGDPPELGGYRLLGRVREDDATVVFQARDQDGPLVEVTTARVVDERLRDRLHAQVAARRTVRFPGAAIVAVDVDGPLPYVVTEHVDGPVLREAVTSGGPLAPPALEGLAVALATALAALHSAGTTHGAVSPDSVVLSATGPRLVGLGLPGDRDARRRRGGGSGDQRSGGAPADILAWGRSVLYAGTGRLPATGEAAPLDLLSPVLRPAVERALDADPARRPSARTLLVHLVGGSGLAAPAARPGQTQPRAGGPGRSRRATSPAVGRRAAAGVALLLTLGLTGAGLAARAGQPAMPRTPPVSEQAAPEQVAPEQVAPEQAAPEQVAPEPAVPGAAAPREPAPPDPPPPAPAVAADQPLQLTADGLAALPFGAAEDAVVAELTRRLGPPDEVSDLVEGSQGTGSCGRGFTRRVRWGWLTLAFSDAPTRRAPAGTRHFYNWLLREPFPGLHQNPDPAVAEPVLTTAAGIGLGSPVQQVRDAYGPGLRILEEYSQHAWFQVEGISGYYSTDLPYDWQARDVVYELWDNAPCEGDR